MEQPTIYARLDGNKILEYPLTIEHIRTRSLPYELLSPVFFENKQPALLFNEVVYEEHRVDRGALYVVYKKKKLSISELLSRTASFLSGRRLSTPLSPTQKLEMSQMQFHLELYFDDKFDQAARRLGYHDAQDLVSFHTSKVERYQRHAAAMGELRDVFWPAFYDLMGRYESGRAPYPSRMADLEQQLPLINIEMD